VWAWDGWGGVAGWWGRPVVAGAVMTTISLPQRRRAEARAAHDAPNIHTNCRFSDALGWRLLALLPCCTGCSCGCGCGCGSWMADAIDRATLELCLRVDDPTALHTHVAREMRRVGVR
jgi:hypothetical protein